MNMKLLNRKWLPVALLLLCFAPASFADNHRRKNSVPEGGSSATYLVGAGLICAGAMFVRFRSSKPRLS
jgi:hypothetical protein